MSFKNVHYDRREGVMYLWDNTVKSNLEPHKIKWNPYCFVKVAKPTGVKSIYGDHVKIEQFNNYYQYITWLKDKKESKTIFENNVKPEIQFCVEKYYMIPDDEIQSPTLHYSVIDIEVDTTKIDMSQVIKCKIGEAEEFFTLEQIKRLHKTPLVQIRGEWVKFDEKLFYGSYGFPEPSLAERPICVISVYNSYINKIYTFGLKEYTGELFQEDWWRYVKCENEKDLINKFMKFMHKTAPDIITGWNNYKFDLAYIINRIRRLYPGKSARISSTTDRPMDETSEEARKIMGQLSPINIVNFWESVVVNEMTKQDETRTIVDIAGISILDYMDLYKQYSGTRLESYSLDFVSKYELEKGKLEYGEYKNLTELYNFNYNKYVDYNVIDVKRVKQLQEKLNYFSLIQALSLLTKCPMKFYNGVTHLSEGAFLTYYRRNNLCAPFAPDGVKEDFQAAYVKEPVPGLYKWVIDLDISSSYPAQMITMNMGLETYIGIINGFLKDDSDTSTPITEEEVIEYTSRREFPPFSMLDKNNKKILFTKKTLEDFNIKLKEGLYAIAPNGVLFRTDIKGSIAEVERYLFYKRVDVRSKQKEVGILRDKIENKESKEFQQLDNKLNQLKNLQMAIKVCLNGTYGAISVPYFRLFNPFIPVAITAGGRRSVHNGEQFTNSVMNNPTLYKPLRAIINELSESTDCSHDIDFVIYIDTDSLYINIYQLLIEQGVSNVFDALEYDKKIDYVKRIGAAIQNYVNDQSYEITQLKEYNSQCTNHKISFKSEKICESGLWVKKKKYMLWCVFEDGYKPKENLQVTGLETIKSSTPSIVKPMIKDVMAKILTAGDVNELMEAIGKYKQELYSASPENISENLTVRNMNSYIGYDGLYKKGTPRHTKGAFEYKALVKDLGLEGKADNIESDEKVKIVYLKKYPRGLDSISFTRWLPEFTEIGLEIDYDKMIKNNFISKLDQLLEAAGIESNSNIVYDPFDIWEA